MHANAKIGGGPTRRVFLGLLAGGATLGLTVGYAIHREATPTGTTRIARRDGSAVAADTRILYCTISGKVYALDTDTGEVRWAQPLNSDATLAVHREGIYLTGIFDHSVYRCNAATGVIQWLYRAPPVHRKTVASDWTLSTLAADGRTIYLTSSRGYTYAIDTATGHPRWRQQTANNTYSAPVVYRGIVYVGGPDLYVYALDAANGDHRWRFGRGSDSSRGPDEPLLGMIRGKLFAGGSHYLYALDPESGKEQGSYPPAAPCSNGVAYTGSMDGSLEARDIVGARVLWTRRLLKADQYDDLRWSSVTVDNNVLYSGLGITGSSGNRNFSGQIIALDAATGASRWNHAVPDTLFTAPVAAAGMVYVAGEYNLYALDAATGRLQWIQSSRSQNFDQPVVN